MIFCGRSFACSLAASEWVGVDEPHDRYVEMSTSVVQYSDWRYDCSELAPEAWWLMVSKAVGYRQQQFTKKVAAKFVGCTTHSASTFAIESEKAIKLR